MAGSSRFRLGSLCEPLVTDAKLKVAIFLTQRGAKAVYRPTIYSGWPQTEVGSQKFSKTRSAFGGGKAG
jgi:hypothetical protein